MMTKGLFLAVHFLTFLKSLNWNTGPQIMDNGFGVKQIDHLTPNTQRKFVFIFEFRPYHLKKNLFFVVFFSKNFVYTVKDIYTNWASLID